MEITNLSFKTDGRTIGVPAEKGKGRFKIADQKSVMNSLEEYSILSSYRGGKEIGIGRD